jgi:hypothetical protein
VRAVFPDRRGTRLGLLALYLCLTSGTYALITGFQRPYGFDLSTWWNAVFGRIGFLSGGPYYNWDQTVTGLFWTLTIFTNQRHFAFGIAVGLFVLAGLIRVLRGEIQDGRPVRQAAVLALLFGLLPFLHGLSFMSFILMAGSLLFFLPRRWITLFFLLLTGILAFPQLRFLSPQNPDAAPIWFTGYGLHGRATLVSFLVYWAKNIGIKWFLIPFAVALLPGLARWIFVAGLSLFILPNLIRFGPDVWTSHKFFNIWMIFLNLGTAYLIRLLWRIRWVGKALAAVLLAAVSLTGLLDLPPIYNDSPLSVADWQTSAVGKYLRERTSTRDVFATSFGIYHPANLTGRTVLLGWPYFSWGAGFETTRRMELVRQIFETKDPGLRCSLMGRMNTRYIVAGKRDDFSEPYHPDLDRLKLEFRTVAEDPIYLVFDGRQSCGFK